MTHSPGPMEAKANQHELWNLVKDNEPLIESYLIPDPETEGTARLLAASYTSYDKHCGPHAVECAERDLLGEALDVARRLLRIGEDGEIPITLIEDARAVLAKLEGK